MIGEVLIPGFSFAAASDMLTRMEDSPQLIRDWIRYGIIAGIVGDFAFVITNGPIPLPESLKLYLAFAFGPLIAMAFLSMYFFFGVYRKTVILQVATIYGVIVGTVINIMLVMQVAIFSSIPAVDAFDTIQLGMSVAWDIYFAIAMLLIGIVMLRNPRFGTVWGAAAILIGGGLFVLKLIALSGAVSVNLRLVSSVFFLLVMIRMWMSREWVDEQLASSA